MVIVLIVILLIGNVLGWWGSSGKKPAKATPAASVSETQEPQETANTEDTVEVPSLVGHTLEEAEKLLEDANLKARLEPVESSEDANKVTDQDPAAGEEVDAYSYVKIYYSQGKSGITIPDVSKLSVSEATSMLEGKGLNVSGTSEAYSDTVDKGKVSGTDPVVGSSVEKNSSVKLIISKGPKSETVKVPNIVNKKLSVALERLADVGLTAPDNPSYVYSDTVKKDYIVSQTVKAATRVEVGTEIGFTVSLGPKSEATPQPTKEESYSYEGSLRINSNPFDYEDEDPATIKLVMEQDGKSRAVYSGTLSYSDFPREFPIKGWSDNNGTVKLFKNDQQIGGTYNVEFKKVKQ